MENRLPTLPEILTASIWFEKGTWHSASENHLAFDPVMAKHNIKTKRMYGLFHITFAGKHVSYSGVTLTHLTLESITTGLVSA